MNNKVQKWELSARLAKTKVSGQNTGRELTLLF
jgi:hypothetical protein